MNTTTVGVDLAKHVFAVCELDGQGRVQQRRQLRREAFVAWHGLYTGPRKQPLPLKTDYGNAVWQPLADVSFEARKRQK